MALNQLRNQHLMWRAGFGPSATQIPELPAISQANLYQALKKNAAAKPSYIDVADDYLKGFTMGAEEIGRQQRRRDLSPEERRKVQQQNREDLKSLNLTWLNEMIFSKAQLREKMAFFWHGHFASRNINIFYQQQLLDIIRTNALGSFRTLLHEASKSAAIINFLNAQQNRKDHPNENFAREVMELFTLGRGNYSETDIKEASRAFTGWGANLRGEFQFRRFAHDTGRKTVFGRTGNFNGDEILDMLLEQKQTARFITGKIYSFFVNEERDQEKIDWLANRFYQNDYNIQLLMDDIFTSTWFYDEKNIGKKIKSPVELIAGIQRMIPLELEDPEALLLVQRLLGQLLFYPPNVSGWPGGRAWIDSSTLMVRLRLPQLMLGNEELQLSAKADDDQMMGRMENNKAMNRMTRVLKADADWKVLTAHFKDQPEERMIVALADILLQVKPKITKDAIRIVTGGNTREAIAGSMALQLMSLPEYQMC